MENKSFDAQFLEIYDSLHVDNEINSSIPSLWDNVSNHELFKKKLCATKELGISLCDSLFSWSDSSNTYFLEDESIILPELLELLRPFSEADPSLENLTTCTRKLTTLLGFKKADVDIMGAIRSFLFKNNITSYNKPSELFQTTSYSKSLLETLSLFPLFCMNRLVLLSNST